MITVKGLLKSSAVCQTLKCMINFTSTSTHSLKGLMLLGSQKKTRFRIGNLFTTSRHQTWGRGSPGGNWPDDPMSGLPVFKTAMRTKWFAMVKYKARIHSDRKLSQPSAELNWTQLQQVVQTKWLVRTLHLIKIRELTLTGRLSSPKIEHQQEFVTKWMIWVTTM